MGTYRLAALTYAKSLLSEGPWHGLFLVAGAGFEPATRGPFLSACQHRFLRLGNGPSATPELDGELIGRQVAHQLLLRGEPRRRRSGERAPVELVAL